jgi:hypothetical protein
MKNLRRGIAGGLEVSSRKTVEAAATPRCLYASITLFSQLTTSLCISRLRATQCPDKKKPGSFLPGFLFDNRSTDQNVR